MPSVDATKIHQGPGKLWLSVSVPASGSRLVINSAGDPTAGSPIFAGATEGAATVRSRPSSKPSAPTRSPRPSTW